MILRLTAGWWLRPYLVLKHYLLAVLLSLSYLISVTLCWGCVVSSILELGAITLMLFAGSSVNVLSVIPDVLRPFFFFFFLDFIYLFNREQEREHKQEEWEREKHAPHWAGSLIWGSMRGSISGPCDPEPSRRQINDWATRASQPRSQLHPETLIPKVPVGPEYLHFLPIPRGSWACWSWLTFQRSSLAQEFWFCFPL